jgi:hypothetical protein
MGKKYVWLARFSLYKEDASSITKFPSNHFYAGKVSVVLKKCQINSTGLMPVNGPNGDRTKIYKSGVDNIFVGEINHVKQMAVKMFSCTSVDRMTITSQ